ncbi:MAG: hypothetical protein QF411_13835, partial [Planctomycetota bacterium]|nr:hypothetical protein [Planctomycetota bacterium]
MARSVTSYDQAAQLRGLREQGWCAFEGFFDGAENEGMVLRLTALLGGREVDSLTGLGCTVFSLLARDPGFGGYLGRSDILSFCARALGVPERGPRLC